MATDALTVKVEFDKEHAMNCIKTVLLHEYGMTLDELAKLCKAKQEGRLREDVQGEWETNSDRPDTLICSVCGAGYDMWKHDPHNFCPNCGARMVGGGER